jgi:CBS domain-containing protein
MKVKDVMHKGVTWVPPEMSLKKVAYKMRRGDIGAVPVCENDRLIGMVTDRDICCRGVGNGRDVSAKAKAQMSGATFKALSAHHA